MIQISFRTQDPNIRQAQSGIRAKNYSASSSTIHSVFKICQSAWFTAKKKTIRAIFEAKSVDPKTYSPPSTMVSWVTKIIITCLPTIGKCFDTMIVESTRAHQVLKGDFTALFNNIQTLKVKDQLTNACFATVYWGNLLPKEDLTVYRRGKWWDF